MEKDTFVELPTETINRFIHPCRALVVGPSMSGKR